MNEELVLLPTTVEELDEFVKSLTEQYALPGGDDTYDAIATMIMHLPHTAAKAPRSHFGHGVLKSMANKAAFTRLQEFAKKREEKKKQEEEEKRLKLVESEQPPAIEQPV